MNPSLLCETVTGDTMVELMAARDAAIEPDMLELRLDGVRGLDVAQALGGRRRPAIVTCRPLWEGGRFAGAEDTRRRVLSEALERGAEYVDIEWRSLRAAGGTGRFDDLLELGQGRVVVSSHDFSGMPGDLRGRALAMRRTGAAMIKLAVTPARLSDTLVLRDISGGGDTVVIGMGDAGVPTRLLASRFGSRWTYGGRGVAPGQLPIAQMLEAFRFRAIRAETALYGVVGRDVMHSLAPVMHNVAFAASRLDAVCVPLRAADFEDFVTFADALGIAGASVAIPFAPDAPAARVLFDDRSRQLGSANTVRRVVDGWEATNTGKHVEPVGAAHGLRKEERLERLIGEAERQFEWWTGRRPGADVMRAAADAHTSHRDIKPRSRT